MLPSLSPVLLTVGWLVARGPGVQERPHDLHEAVELLTPNVVARTRDMGVSIWGSCRSISAARSGWTMAPRSRSAVIRSAGQVMRGRSSGQLMSTVGSNAPARGLRRSLASAHGPSSASGHPACVRISAIRSSRVLCCSRANSDGAGPSLASRRWGSPSRSALRHPPG